jgi:hypothetical protein
MLRIPNYTYVIVLLNVVLLADFKFQCAADIGCTFLNINNEKFLRKKFSNEHVVLGQVKDGPDSQTCLW